MKYFKFIGLGVVFGIVLAKAQVISWYRIYEMFRFESFHMYGVIGSAVVCGVLITAAMRKREWKSHSGRPITWPTKEKTVPRYLLGGIVFGLGWALAGTCPAPMFVLLGFGYSPLMLVIGGALLGTLLYGGVRRWLWH